MVTLDLWEALALGQIPLSSKVPDALKGVDQSPVIGPTVSNIQLWLCAESSSSSPVVCRLGLGQREGGWQGSRCSLEHLALDA